MSKEFNSEKCVKMKVFKEIVYVAVIKLSKLPSLS